MDMAPAWISVGWLCLALALCSGCRTSQKQLVEPPKEADVLNIPPIEDARYNSAEYPQAALASRNKNRKLYDDSKQNIMPARGSMGGRPGSGMNGGL